MNFRFSSVRESEYWYNLHQSHHWTWLKSFLEYFHQQFPSGCSYIELWYIFQRVLNSQFSLCSILPDGFWGHLSLNSGIINVISYKSYHMSHISYMLYAPIPKRFLYLQLPFKSYIPEWEFTMTASAAKVEIPAKIRIFILEKIESIWLIWIFNSRGIKSACAVLISLWFKSESEQLVTVRYS